jgi:uncharacterized protein YjiS (DUF1127 family)
MPVFGHTKNAKLKLRMIQGAREMSMISSEGLIALRRQWAGASPIERLAPGLTKLWRQYSVRQARKATMAILQSLDDRTLKDIGIHRSEIENVVRDDRAERLLR